MSLSEEEMWSFNFAVVSNNDSRVPHTDCMDLLDLIIDWAEARDLSIGGGFSSDNVQVTNKGPHN